MYKKHEEHEENKLNQRVHRIFKHKGWEEKLKKKKTFIHLILDIMI